MALRETSNIEAVAGGPNQRVYIPQALRIQHLYPFRPGEPIGLQLVETDDERQVLVLTKGTLRVDAEETTISVEQSRQDVQSSLTELEEGGAEQ